MTAAATTVDLVEPGGPGVTQTAGGLAELRDHISSWCAALDPDLVTGEQAARAAEALAGSIRQLQAAQVRLARRTERCRAYTGRARSAEQWLAQQNGSSLADSRRALDTARRLEQCPGAAGAFASGALSLAEADAVSGAAVLDPAAEARLVARATSSHDLKAVRDDADRVRQAARSHEDDAARHARQRRSRYWREFAADDGLVGISARVAPADWLPAKAALDAFAAAQVDAARREGRPEPADAHRADAAIAALVQAGRIASGGGGGSTAPVASEVHADRSPHAASDGETVDALVERLFDLAPDRVKVEVLVLVDGSALKRGRVVGEERCEIPGLGTISVDLARRLLRDRELHVLIHDAIDIRAYATDSRYRPKPLNFALAARHPVCAVPGCHAAVAEIDHVHPRSDNGPSCTTNCVGLCRFHHDQKTHRGARLVVTATEILWWPPLAVGAAPPPPGTIPWRAPLGEHLPAWTTGSDPQTSPT